MGGVVGCRIEPPLHLAELTNGQVMIGEVVTEIEIIWGIEPDWENEWWYGWDADDISAYGDLSYPQPTNYEAFFMYLGTDPDADGYQSMSRTTLYSTRFRRQYSIGYHDMVIYSNIDSDDGTQVLVVDDADPYDIHATTTVSRLGYAVLHQGSIYNYPEIFYAGELDGFYISPNFEDYDYFDDELQAWVKYIYANMYPMVYIYLVQVAVYNNNGRITSLADNPVLANMSDGVKVNTGHTHDSPGHVAYPMRLKKGLTARDGRDADIFGGKLTTFGLCDMECWSESRDNPQYAGSRSDLRNHVYLDLSFSNSTDSVYGYDVTDQVRRQSHGGIITIEIDMDTLKRPTSSSSGAGSGFDPYVAPQDSIQYEFGM